MSEDRDFRVLCDLHAQGMHVTVGYEATADGARNVHFFPITRQGPGVKSQIVGFIKQYLKEQELPRERVHLVMAVAGPVIDDAVHVPALNVDLTDGRLKAELKVASVEMVNDMFACALALPAILAEGNYLRLGGRRPLHGYPILIICLRPELGSVAMVPFTWKPPVNAPDASPIFFPVFSEVGHILLAPGADEQEIAFVDARARAMGKRIEAGDVFQTDGVRAAYNFVQQREANEDSVGDQWKEDSLTARLGRQVWTRVFGTFLRSLALSFGCQGGVYITGSLARDIFGSADQETLAGFRESFERKGPTAKYLEEIPVHLILEEMPFLRGLDRITPAPPLP